MNKSHLFFRNPVEGVESYRPRSRAVFEKEEEELDKNYAPMKKVFQNSLRGFNSAKNQRDNHRSRDLSIPLTIDFIQIEFFSHFNIDPFENRYRNNFGLAPIRYDDFNYVGLFAVDDTSKFQNFIENINLFVSNTDDSDLPSGLEKNILFIRNFKYYTSSDRKKYTEHKENYILELVDSSVDIYENKIELIENSLIEYLRARRIIYTIDKNKLEISNISNELMNEIIDNYDIVMTVNSPTSGVVKPSPFNLEIKDYGFEISNPGDDLPIVGIIDTGVSALTPLAPLIINEGIEFDLTNTDPRVDNESHGTAVAAIASLGKSFYQNNLGAVEADAKILSIKALDADSGFVSENEIRKLVVDANNKYGIKIFVLCLGYIESKLPNSSISNYAYSLDILANELDILIFISVGNAHHHCFDTTGNLIDYPYQFNTSLFNITVPSDSMNNICCGAISNNLENKSANCYNIYDPLYPASFTRKFFINRKSVKASLLSKHFTKPDICDCGGDIDLNTECNVTGLKVLSANPGIFFERIFGTSFSTPFIANQALKLLRIYPQLKENIQTIKALILNSCRLPNTGNLFDNLSEVCPSDLMGKGIPETDNSLYSNENKITMVLEDSIRPGFIKSYPIKLPAYLLELDKQNSLLEINATLCYKFNPILYNHLAYCPVHITFGIFRDIKLELIEEGENGKVNRKGINGGLYSDYVFKESWSEDYYFKAKMLSNCQKIRFVISKRDLLKDNCQFKIAIRSKLHGFLNMLDKEKNDILHPYSLVISIHENPVKGILSNRLYGEMIAINELEAVAEIEAEIELDN